MTCWWCHRAIGWDDAEVRRVTVERRDAWVCGRCWERVSPDVPLDMMEGYDGGD